MAILRLERAVYAVEDLPACARFFEDFGLAPLAIHDDRATFTTQIGQIVDVRRLDDRALPPPLEPGSTLRELVWGVDDQHALDALIDDLRRDREVTITQDGVAHTHDETGFGLGLALARPVEPDLAADEVNTFGHVGRWNRERNPPPQVRPIRICHVAWNIPKDGRERAVAFYTDRLHFRVVDDVLPMGAFMQCEGDDDQHNLLLCHRPDRAGINHISYEVRNAEEVILGGNQMIERGWREARRLGRHTVGSNFFRFVHAPCGGRVEYAADMDRVDDTYPTRVHEVTPPHHLWTLATNRDGDQ